MPATMPSAPDKTQAKLLFIDDEQKVLSSMKAMFRRKFQVLTANSGSQALQLLENESVDVVISDQRMPEMTGVEVLSKIKVQHPSIIRILLTGYADLDAVEASINECEVFRYLMKPCPPEQLSEVIKEALSTELKHSPKEAELIQFPVANTRIPPREADAKPQGRPKTTPRKTEQVDRKPATSLVSESPAVGILVLSADRDLFLAIKEAAPANSVRQSSSMEMALAIIRDRQIGVVISDSEVDGQDAAAITRQLRQIAPNIVPIVASERSDAHALINLINSGDIYRFMMKPVSQGQCRLWLNSAATRYLELQGGDAPAQNLATQNAGLVSIISGAIAKLFGRIPGVRS
jgi:serine/threonine-protein kinase